MWLAISVKAYYRFPLNLEFPRDIYNINLCAGVLALLIP